MNLIKPVIRLGNSAGVLLPKAWLNGKAKITLIESPIDIEKEIIGFLKPYLPSLISLGIAGSYARNEANVDSDIDIIGITSDVNKRIEKGKYNICLISQKDLEYYLENDALPILPMLKESVPLINSQLLEIYSRKSLSRKNLSFHIATTLSALEVIKKALNLSQINGERISDNIAYSLMLRLREVYIVDNLIEGKKANKKGLLVLLKKITGSLEAYEAYIRAKNGNSNRRSLAFADAEKILAYIPQRINWQKKWIRRKS